MNRSLVLAAAAAVTMWFTLPLFAQDAEPLPLPVKKPVAQASSQKSTPIIRSESLEMPGVTACHQCEWRPKPNEMAAPDQCGIGLDGKPKIAQFECGFSQECDRVCNFVRCLTQ